MKIRNTLNYAFFIGLILLILNDHFFKAEFGNMLTGKLSDFAGLFIFPMFLKYLFSVSTRKSIMMTVVFFIFWKSPFSQYFIDAFNSFGLFRLARVVDYTDFIAFLILPLTMYVLDNIEKFEIKFKDETIRKIATNSLLLVSMIVFTATSKDDDYNDFQSFELLQSCCDSNPTAAEIGLGKIYIPTAFTPDGNGLNDLFQISADTNISKIDTFLVFNQTTGATVFNKLNITEIIPENGFDGIVADTIIATQYEYLLVVTSKDNVQEKFFGLVCCLPCQMPLNIPTPNSIDNCAFSIQYDPINGYDNSIDSGEALDCFD